jgi:hypothetical protein
MINLDAEDKNVAKLDELVNKFGFEVRIPTGPQLMFQMASSRFNRGNAQRRETIQLYRL